MGEVRAVEGRAGELLSVTSHPPTVSPVFTERAVEPQIRLWFPPALTLSKRATELVTCPSASVLCVTVLLENRKEAGLWTSECPQNPQGAC